MAVLVQAGACLVNLTTAGACRFGNGLRNCSAELFFLRRHLLQLASLAFLWLLLQGSDTLDDSNLPLVILLHVPIQHPLCRFVLFGTFLCCRDPAPLEVEHVSDAADGALRLLVGLRLAYVWFL